MTKKKPRDQRVASIIRAAIEEFMQSGFEGTSMEAIARRSSLSKGGLYHHFNSKDEILIEANRLLNEPVGSMMEKAGREESPSRAICHFIEQYLKYWKEHQKELVFFFLSFTKVLDSPPLWQMYADYTNEYVGFFETLYQQGIEKGEFAEHPPYQSAITLTTAMDGITGHLVINPNLQIKTIIRHFQNKFVHSLSQASQHSTKQESISEQ
jgi:AcrR family transcriptional regulator